MSTIEKRQGFKISCLEEIAWRQSWLNDEDLERSANKYSTSEYGKYLKRILEEKFVKARMP